MNQWGDVARSVLMAGYAAIAIYTFGHSANLACEGKSRAGDGCLVASSLLMAPIAGAFWPLYWSVQAQTVKHGGKP